MNTNEPRISKKIINNYSSARVALMAEVNKHPALCEILSNYDRRREWAGMVGEIAAYCVVIMDGYYYESELERLYEILVLKLQKRRSIIITQ